MEIIAEIFLQLLGWIFQFFGELFLQVIVEGIAELIGHGFKDSFRRDKPLPPWLAVAGYLLLGALAGALSLWLVPEVFIKSYWLRLANLLLTPFASALIMTWIGSWRRKRDKEVIRLETFAYAFCFAFAMTAARFLWGRVAM